LLVDGAGWVLDKSLKRNGLEIKNDSTKTINA